MTRLLLPLLLAAALPALAEPFALLETREPNIAALERYEVNAPLVPYAGVAKAAFPQGLPLAVGSGLRFKGYEKATSALEFWSLTDRGPNVDSPDVADGKGKRASKVFAVPDYTPTITQLRVSLAEKAEVIKTLPLKQDGKPISGRPIARGRSVPVASWAWASSWPRCRMTLTGWTRKASTPTPPAICGLWTSTAPSS